MISLEEARDLVDEIFEEEALLIGGIVAVHGMDDDLVWRLIRNLDVIRGRVLRRLDNRDEDEIDDSPNEKVNLNPHPAIQDFLIKIRREGEWAKHPSS